jgi:hypothetical protein
MNSVCSRSHIRYKEVGRYSNAIFLTPETACLLTAGSAWGVGASRRQALPSLQFLHEHNWELKRCRSLSHIKLVFPPHIVIGSLQLMAQDRHFYSNDQVLGNGDNNSAIAIEIVIKLRYTAFCTIGVTLRVRRYCLHVCRPKL